MIPPLITAGILKFVCNAPIWMILMASMAILVLAIILWTGLMWLIFGRNKMASKPREIGIIEKIIRRDNPERLLPELNVEKYEETTPKTNVRYCCGIRVNANMFMENFRLEIVDFSPIPRAASFGHSLNKLPDKCPIILKSRIGRGDIINDGSSDFFELFKLIRNGTIPSIAIQDFSQFPISIKDNRDASNPIFNEYNFSIKATAKDMFTKIEKFKVNFNHDHRGVASFDVEKIITTPKQ